MSRSGYIEDCDDQWALIRWRGAVKSAIRGKRGQAFLREMLTAMDAMPVKRLIAHELEATDLIPVSHGGVHEVEPVCAIGTVGKTRGIDMSKIDPEDYDTVAGKFGIASPMAREIAWKNDECGRSRETPEERFQRMRKWIVSQIKESAS
jgi:hypothetical protein